MSTTWVDEYLPDKGSDDKDKETETTIKLSEAPKAVRDAVRRNAGGRKVEEVEKTVYGGIAIYEVDFADGSMVFSEGGLVIEEERDMKPSELPKPVRAAIAKKCARFLQSTFS